MPLVRSRLRRVTVKAPLPLPVYGDRAGYAFEAVGRTLFAAVQPLSGTAEEKLYGEEAAQMLLMLLWGHPALAEGMGVCAERTDGVCDYRVVAPPERWGGHTRAVLKRL